MKIKEIRVKRLINLGNYENAEVSISVQVDDDEDPQAAFEKARTFVEANIILMYPERIH